MSLISNSHDLNKTHFDVALVAVNCKYPDKGLKGLTELDTSVLAFPLKLVLIIMSKWRKYKKRNRDPMYNLKTPYEYRNRNPIMV